ncbi:MAG TPA: patatin-like phospholipase family protein [Bacteroidales bacterium]
MSRKSDSLTKHFLRTLLITSFFWLVFFSHTVNSAAQDISRRPKVGLVLSGGGAHGITHLGVIKVMEEAGLRPDYITGVSMGSIIGGMYSLGYSADSLNKILNSINWKVILSNKIQENKVIFLEKSHFANSAISLPLSLRKVVLPSGLINGQLVENTLSYFAWPAADINDFSKLPIPFMCLGTDIITYAKIKLKTGYLPDAIRASFAVPSIFTPLKIDSLLLLDGGLIRNFAASEVREMGADIVIGSYVGFSGYKEDKLQSVSGIMEQIAMFRSLADFEEQKKLVDVLIMPDTKGFSIFGFENVDSLIQRGYKAALPYKKYFKKLADSLNQIGMQKPLDNILEKQTYTFNKIEINGNKSYSDEQILGMLDIEPGKKVDKYLLTERIELLFGKAWFDKVKYRVIPRNDSLILAIDCIEKPQAMIYGSVHYDNSLLSGLIFEISGKNLLTQRSVINFGSRIGQYYKFELSYLQFIDRNQIFGFSTNLFSDNTMLPLLEIRGDKGEVISRNFTPGLSINRRIGLNNMMNFSVNYEKLNLILHYISDVHLKNLSYNYLTEIIDYKVNSLDNRHFPEKGTILNISVSTSKLLSAGIKTDSSKTEFKWKNNREFTSDRFYTFHGCVNHYFNAPGKLTCSIGGDVLLITKSDSVSAQNNFYLLGGVESVNKRSVPMVGFQSNEIPVKKLAGFRTGLDMLVFEDFHLNIMANIFVIQEANRNSGFSLLTGFGIGAGYMSIIGPIKIGLMYGIYNREQYFNKIKGYISIGYNF